MHVEDEKVLENARKWMNYCATRFLNVRVKLEDTIAQCTRDENPAIGRQWTGGKRGGPREKGLSRR